MGSVLALDLGSSSVRALILNLDGSLAAPQVARRPVSVRYSPRGAAELDADSYLELVFSCIDELQAADLLGGVAEVAVASQWHSLLALDARGSARSPALTWADTRGGPGPIGPKDPAAFHARTGTWSHRQYWTGKAPWLLAEVPEHCVPGRAAGAAQPPALGRAFDVTINGLRHRAARLAAVLLGRRGPRPRCGCHAPPADAARTRLGGSAAAAVATSLGGLGGCEVASRRR